MLETGPISYSSILKTTRKKGNLSIAAAKPVPKKDVNANPIIASGASLGNPEAGNSNAAGTTKKVKKKDPITYDLFSALQAVGFLFFFFHK